jgi:hypothetical protein
MRVLHLLDPAHAGDEGALACAAALTIAGAGHEVWTVGDAHAERRAWALGIPSVVRIPERRGPLAPAAATARLLRSLLRRHDVRPDIVQCYSLPMLALARRAVGERTPPRVGVVPHRPIPRAGRGAHAVAADLEWATTAVLEAGARDILAPRSLSAIGRSRQADDLRVLEPPCFPPGGPPGVGRQAVRERLGLEPTDTAVGLLADPPWAGDAYRIAFALGLAKALTHRGVAVVRRGAAQERRAARFVRSQARRWNIVLADLTLPELVAASDVLVLDAAGAPGAARPSAGPTALSLAASMGVPVACAVGAEPTPGRAAHPPLLHAPSPVLGRVALPVVHWLERPDLRVAHAAALRAWAASARARDAYRRTLHALWLEAANVPSPAEGLPTPTLLTA